MNEYFKMIFILVIIFSFFICLEKTKYFEQNMKIKIIEGADNIQPSDLPGSSFCLGPVDEGNCNDSEKIDGRCPINDSLDERSCTGRTGWNLQWKKKGVGDNTLRDFLLSFEPSLDQYIIEKEDSILHNDIFSLNDNPSNSDIYLYKENKEINGDELITEIPILPWFARNNNEITELSEYCINIDPTSSNDDFGTLIPDNDENECITNNNKLWITPNNYELMRSQYEIKMPDVFKQPYCSSIDISERNITNANGTCVDLQDLYVPHCVSEDGTEVQPIRWWKDIWIPGKTIQDICEGQLTGNIWRAGNFSSTVSASLVNYVQSQSIDAIQSESARQKINEIDSVAQQTIEQQAESGNMGAREALEVLNNQYQEQITQSCSFEGDYLGNENTSHGNTIGGYTFSGNIEGSNNVHELIQNNNILSCNSDNFSRINNNINPSVYCDNGTFRFEGCKPNSCIIDESFNIDKYRFIDNSPMKEIDDTYIVSDFINPVTGESKIECSDGNYLSSITVECSYDETEDRYIGMIQGCNENTCVFDINENKYSFINNSSDNSIRVSDFINDNFNLDEQKNDRYLNCPDDQLQTADNLTNEMSQNFHGSCFKCNHPNHYHINDNLNNSERLTNVYDSIQEEYNSDTSIYSPYNFGAKISCLENNQDFTLNGCYENKCLNPSLSNQVYDINTNKPIATRGNNSQQPDTLSISDDNIYSKYKYSSDIFGNQILTTKQMENILQCGNNYHNNNDNNIVSLEDIKCYNFFDIENRNDDNNTDVPYFKDIDLNGDTTDLIITKDNFSESKWCDHNLGSCNSNFKEYTNLNFSVQGCEPNYCSWPIDSNEEPIDGYEIGELNNPTYEDWNVDSKLSAANWANITTDYNQNENSIRCKSSCEQELINNDYMIQKCWESNTPTVSCLEDDGIAEVNGCSLKKCNLSLDDINNGLNIVINDDDNNEINISNNADNLSFDVKQIITLDCENGYIKGNINDPIEISCENDTFLIGNKCQPLKCIIPNQNAPNNSYGKLTYDNLSLEDKELYNKIDINYNLPGQYNTGNELYLSDISDNICSDNSVENTDITMECNVTNIGFCVSDSQNKMRDNCGSCSDDSITNRDDCINSDNIWTNGEWYGLFTNIVGESSVCEDKMCQLPNDETMLNGYIVTNDNETSSLSQLKESLDDQLVSINSISDITCSDNYTNLNNENELTNINIECQPDTGIFNFSGCNEKKCRLPIFDNYDIIQYSYTGDNKERLEELTNEDENEMITLSQFSSVSEDPLMCVPWATNTQWTCDLTKETIIEPTEDRNMNDRSSLLPDKICYNENTEQEPPEGYQDGYYEPVSIEPMAVCENNGDYFEYTGCRPQLSEFNSFEGGQYYYQMYPGDCVGGWSGGRFYRSGSGDGTGDVQSITHNSDGEEYPESLKDEKMKEFMDMCYNQCDNVDDCSGFTVIKMDSSIDDTRISDSTILDGVMICEQKSLSNICIKDPISNYNWSDTWGSSTHYRDVEMGTQTYSVIKHEIIPYNHPIYFEKLNSDELR